MENNKSQFSYPPIVVNVITPLYSEFVEYGDKGFGKISDLKKYVKYRIAGVDDKKFLLTLSEMEQNNYIKYIDKKYQMDSKIQLSDHGIAISAEVMQKINAKISDDRYKDDLSLWDSVKSENA